MNLQHLQSLLGDDEERVEQFLSIFRREIPLLLENLENAIVEENWSDASNFAHSIKSQVRYLGLDDVANLAEDIEYAAEGAHNLEHLMDWARQLRGVLSVVLNQL